ncbi:MAG TPA: 3-dehydroquinate synthase [Sphingomicrobium sp.]|nr:3-dehydroquinate synthase [Sphingomicrobium sp.]
MTLIRIQSGPSSYDVLVGPIDAGIDTTLAKFVGAAPIMVSEPRVFGFHGTRIAALLSASDPILVPEGEAAKDWAVLHDLLGEFARRKVDRDTSIIALGGGSVGDLTGLAAALFKRGCPIIHVPTTLLAQADSAIGGKTAIDAFGEKNLVGTFHQPSLVLADPALLETLDPRQLRSGYAEVVKYGLIDDAPFFDWCEANSARLLAGDRDARHHAVVTAITAKARIIAGDIEDRAGQRALLNLGHSFGHAIEAEAGIGQVLHGEAVAIGTVLAFRFSAELGHCPATDADRVTHHLSAAGLPTKLAEAGVEGPQLLDWLSRDKKNKGTRLALILTRGIGRAFLERSVDPQRLAAFLAAA